MRQRHLLRRLETIRTSARRMIFGSIVPQLEMLSVLEPAASWNAGNRRRCAEFVGFAPGQRTFPRTETEIAIARRDVDIAYAVDHGMRIDGRKAERGAAAEQAHNASLLGSAHCRRMLGYHRGQA